MSDLIESTTVAIITCNRPAGLAKLLSALMRLEFPHFPTIKLTVVVVENGRKLKAEEQVECYRAQGLNVVYAHEPIPGISYARNRAMDLAVGMGEYFAFIDDDEYPEPNWLDALLCCSIKYEASVVCGPVIPVFEEGVPLWAEAGGFFDRGRYVTGHNTKYCASNNVLMKSDFMRQSGIRFDSDFALTGGSDTLFFLQLRESTGVGTVWCDEAIVKEDIPGDRVSVGWIIQRSIRVGSTMPNYDAIIGHVRFFRLRWISHGIAHLLIALFMGVPSLFRGDVERIRASREFGLGAGMIRGSFGQVLNEYEGRHGK